MHGLHADQQQALPGVPASAAAHWAAAAAAAAAHCVPRLPLRTEALERVRSERKLKERIKHVDWKLGKQSLEMLPEYGVKLQLLKTMDFVSDSEVRSAPPLGRALLPRALTQRYLTSPA